jgi:hypothetical protein
MQIETNGDAISVNVAGPGSNPGSVHVPEPLICDCDEHVAPPCARRCDPMPKVRGHKLVLFQPSKVEKALAKRQVKEISQ